MSLCINPNCQQAKQKIDQGLNLFCSSCGSQLIINDCYRVDRRLGDGGFGITYLVSDAGTPKVLKVLHNTEPKAIELFEQEAKVLKNLNHVGIPKVEPDSPFLYEPNGSPPVHCLVMEYIEGEDLEGYMRKRNFKPLSERAAIRWLRELVEILDVVHGANYFHRDIKPPNIMIRNSGQLALIDFGTAREETQTYFQKQKSQGVTGIISTGYTPHEQMHGKADFRSDFFALGRTFVFLATGKNPSDFSESLRHGLQWQGEAAGYSQQFKNFLDDMMRPDVNERPSNTKTLLNQLNLIESALYGQAVTTSGSQQALSNQSIPATQVMSFRNDHQIQNHQEQKNLVANNVPSEIIGWNWGAFLLGPFWAIRNGLWIGLFCFIPYVGWLMSVALALKGNEWSWKNGKWKSIEKFKKSQRNWSIAGWIVVGVFFTLGFLGALD